MQKELSSQGGWGAFAQVIVQSSLVAMAQLLGLQRRRTRASGRFLRSRWFSLSENLCSFGVRRLHINLQEENEIPAGRSQRAGRQLIEWGDKPASDWSGVWENLTTSPRPPGGPPGQARLKFLSHHRRHGGVVHTAPHSRCFLSNYLSHLLIWTRAAVCPGDGTALP